MFDGIHEQPVAAFWEHNREQPDDEITHFRAVNHICADEAAEILSAQEGPHLGRFSPLGPVQIQHLARALACVCVDVVLHCLKQRGLAVADHHLVPEERERDAHSPETGPDLKHRTLVDHLSAVLRGQPAVLAASVFAQAASAGMLCAARGAVCCAFARLSAHHCRRSKLPAHNRPPVRCLP